MSNLEKLSKRLDQLFIIFISFQLVLGITIYFAQTYGFSISFEINPDQLKVYMMVLNLLLIMSSHFLFSALKKNKPQSQEIPLSKITIGYTARFILLMAAIISNLLAFLISGDTIFLMLFAVVFILNFAYRPLVKGIKKEFGLEV